MRNLPVYLYLISICLPVCLPACLSVCGPVCMSDRLFICLPVCLSVYRSAYLSVSLPACLPAFMSACLPAFISCITFLYFVTWLLSYLHFFYFVNKRNSNKTSKRSVEKKLFSDILLSEFPCVTTTK